MNKIIVFKIICLLLLFGCKESSDKIKSLFKDLVQLQKEKGDALDLESIYKI